MYERFHRDQVDVVQTYPHMVREEIEDFDLAIRSYFSVDREMPTNQQVRIYHKSDQSTSPHISNLTNQQVHTSQI